MKTKKVVLGYDKKPLPADACELCKGTGRRGFPPRSNCEYPSLVKCRRCKGTGKKIVDDKSIKKKVFSESP